MIQPPDRKHAGDPPMSRAVAMACTVFSLLIVPLGFLMMARAISLALRRWLVAADPDEQRYWGLNAAGHVLIAYSAIMLALLVAEDLRGEPWRLAQWWPSLARLCMDSGNRTVVLLLDLLSALAAGLCMLCAARFYGDADESDRWRASDRLAGKRRADDISPPRS